jgi:hypothetical protein
VASLKGHWGHESGKWQSTNNGLPTGEVCYTWEFESVSVQREVKYDYRTLRKKENSGSHTLICHYRCGW